MANYNRLRSMLSTGEVARLLEVHPSTVRRWSNRGIIKAYRIGSRGERKFRREDVYLFRLKHKINDSKDSSWALTTSSL